MGCKPILRPQTVLIFFCAAFASTQLFAQFDLSWYSIDGGGGHSVGGTFELEGTIGQLDAGVMTGGNYELTGGFWAAAQDDSVLSGDVNLDGVVNLLDVAPFVDRISTGTFQAEADINQDGVVNLLDVTPFVDLLSGG